MQFGIKFPAHRLQAFFRGHLLVFFVVFADRLNIHLDILAFCVCFNFLYGTCGCGGFCE